MTPKQILGCTPEQIGKLKDQIGRSSASKIPSLISLGTELDVGIAMLQEVLDAVKARMRDGAESSLRDNGIRETAGSSWTESGPDGEVCTVSFPRAGVVRGFWLQPDGLAYAYRNEERVCLGDVKGLAGKKFNDLFLTMFKPCKGFVEVAPRALDDKKAAAQLIECLSELPGAGRVAFKLKKPGA